MNLSRSFALLVLGMMGVGAATAARADIKSQLYERYLERRLEGLRGADRVFGGGIFASSPDDQLPVHKVDSYVFDQSVTHAANDTHTFPQRYYINAEAADGPNSPVILYICGEAACTDKQLTKGAILAYAAKLHAVLVTLEHRYYGKSQPHGTLSAPDLKELTTTLALQDLATFQKYATEKHSLRGKWVVVGGSYAGSLSAYYRQTYPQLVVGSLSSSGPVQARENFEEYDHHVATVAGAACAAKMREATRQIEAAIPDAAKFAAIKKEFDASDVRDATDFLYVVADMGAIAVQYGHKDELCDALLAAQAAELVSEYARVGKDLFKAFGITALEDSFQGIESEDPKTYENNIGMRSWMWQSCLEYGYFQNAYHDAAVTVRSTRINPAYHASVCKRFFGLGPVNVSAVNEKLYQPLLDAAKATNIFFTNGSTDPWSKLGITPENGNASNPKVDVFVIQGAAHCDDLHADKPTDSSSLKQARTMFSAMLARWLQ